MSFTGEGSNKTSSSQTWSTSALCANDDSVAVPESDPCIVCELEMKLEHNLLTNLLGATVI